MLNTSFEIDTKVVDLFTISLPNSVINSVSLFCVPISKFLFYINFLRSFTKKGPSHHKELLDISRGRNLVIISAGFSLQYFHKDGFTLCRILMALFCTNNLNS